MKIYEIIKEEQEVNEGLVDSAIQLVKAFNISEPILKARRNIQGIKSFAQQGDYRFDTPEKVQKGINQELTQCTVSIAAMLAGSKVLGKIIPMLTSIIPFFGRHPIVRVISGLLSTGSQVYLMHWLNSTEAQTLLAKWITGQTVLGGGDKATQFIGGTVDTAFTKLSELLPDTARSMMGMEPQGGQGGQSAEPSEPSTSTEPEVSDIPTRELLRGKPGEYAGPGFVRDPKTGQIKPKTGIPSIDTPTR